MLADHHQRRRLHPIDVRHGRSLPDQVGHLVHGPAEQGAVVGLERGGGVVVGGRVVADRNAGDAARPPVWVQAQRQQRHVAAPGPAADRGRFGVGDPLVDQVVEAGHRVLHLREADVADDGVPPGAAVPGGASVVDHGHGDAVVHVRLHIRHPRVHVQPVRPAMHMHQGGKGSGPFRGHDEAVDPTAVRIRRVERPVRPPPGSAFALGSQDLGAGPVHQPGGRLAARDPEPDLTVGPDPRAVDLAGCMRDLGDLARGQVQAECSVQAVVDVEHQEGRPVRPPVHRESFARQVELDVRALAGGQVPDRRAMDVAAFVRDGQAPVARDGRPGPSRERKARSIGLLAHDLAGAWIHHQQPVMDVVARLGNEQAEEILVGRQPRGGGPLELQIAQRADRHPVGSTEDLLRRPAVLGDEQAEALPVGQHRRHERAPHGDAVGPAGGRAREERARLPTFERDRHPLAGLVAGRVPEPGHLIAAPGRGGQDHADRLVGHAPPGPGGAVPRVSLVLAPLVRDEHEPVRSVPGPVRKLQIRGPEAPLPQRHRVGHRCAG